MRTATLAIPVSCPDRMFLCLAEDGTSRTLDLDKKWSSAIFEELMDIAGGNPWERWKRERTAAGLLFVDKPEPRSKFVAPKKQTESLEMAKLLYPEKKGAAAVLP